MSFNITNLLTMIVRAHDQHKIAIGKVMRVTLQAAANGTLPISDHKGSALNLSEVDRNYLGRLAAEAEAQNEVRWWTKLPWSELQRVFVDEPVFLAWFDRETGPSAPADTEKTPANDRDLVKQSRARPETARAAQGLKALYPDGNIPDQRSVPNKVLLKGVNNCLTNMTPPLAEVKMDSLLRASGRRGK
jgi:hypothetical protein